MGTRLIFGDARQNKTEFVSILSAKGSQNFPKFEIHLYFLAKKPSNASVTDAMINKITPNITFKCIVIIESLKEKEYISGPKLITTIGIIIGTIKILIIVK